MAQIDLPEHVRFLNMSNDNPCVLHFNADRCGIIIVNVKLAKPNPVRGDIIKATCLNKMCDPE